MKQTIFLCLGLALLAACTQTAKLAPPTAATVKTDAANIRCLQVMYVVPEMVPVDGVTNLDTNYAHIYWVGNQLQYVMTHTRHHSIMTEDGKRQRTKYKDIRRLVFAKDSTYGAYYDDQNALYNKRVPADSILKDGWVGGNKNILHTAATNDTLQRSGILPGSDTLREVWGYGVKAEPTVYGNVQLYFVPKRHGLPYSLDTAAERAKGMTLCKLFMYFHSSNVSAKGEPQVVEITMHYEFKEIPVTNAAELWPYFERQKRGGYSAQVAEVLK